MEPTMDRDTAIVLRVAGCLIAGAGGLLVLAAFCGHVVHADSIPGIGGTLLILAIPIS